MKTAKYFINKLGLKPHPEGGFYKETYRAKEEIVNIYGNKRNVSTAIFFLLADQNKSHFHKIRSDEQWFHHFGETLEILYIEENTLKTMLLGNNLENGEVLQATIPANTWFASRMKNYKGYGLVSCTVSPGFDFEDFEMAKKKELMSLYPGLKNILEEMCLN
ncbi:cupin domain-containing protein [Pedobacter sp. SD-b]|uniref:Cupin domain-containing protein n=1 Tax=Pedobacter segetis TaxID=2793069 RepID=A0ABS1BKI9_9SPHI|nr:cupin domain-containing protein [Pedobacter segetis]MBK0383318.1 cupin domain-containing protein [Pedobacter segetis]